MKIIPTHNNFTFKFDDEVTESGAFQEQSTDWGFDFCEDMKIGGDCNRVVTVVEAGPKCTMVKPGDKVVLKALMWTLQVQYNNEQVWRSDEKQIVATVQ